MYYYYYYYTTSFSYLLNGLIFQQIGNQCPGTSGTRAGFAAQRLIEAFLSRDSLIFR